MTNLRSLAALCGSLFLLVVVQQASSAPIQTQPVQSGASRGSVSSSTTAPLASAEKAASAGTDADLGSLAHEQAVMKSSYCADCHPAEYAEHEQTTHGRAFTDEEARLATGRFSQADCIICHTPRPIFESGIGNNPIRRHFDLEEGNSCMTCHWKEGQDYSRFTGGTECKSAFDPRVGEVEACASCHRNHGTPFQWAEAKNGRLAGNVCIDCHMPEVERAVAVGGPVRSVRSHLFPASRSETQLRRAYDYSARLDGNEVVVTITNKGAGHNFPTELKQRSIESLVVVKDESGKEIGRSRMTFRDPYKRPYGLTLPVNTQIPSGESREHRVPIGVANGTVLCDLHYKLYYPIEDFHPDLARRLESRVLPFSNLEPSTKPIESEPEVRVQTPENIPPELAGPANLVDYAHPPIGTVDVDVPKGSAPEDIEQLIALFQFPVPQANVEARKQLVKIGLPAVPALIEGMGSWDNKTFNQSMAVLEKIGAPAVPAVVEALESEQLYVRLHACDMLGRMALPAEQVAEPLKVSLERPNALDRSAAASAVGECGVTARVPELRKRLLEDRDPDVVRACARALAQLGAHEAVADLRAAFERFDWPETRRDLADALARLGDPSGIPTLIRSLDLDDDLVRESCFETLFDATGKHFGYQPLAPRDERLAAISQFERWWTREGGPQALRKPIAVPLKIRMEVHQIVLTIGGTDGTIVPGDDQALYARLLEIGVPAVPGLARVALKFPSGFSEKRIFACRALGEIGHQDAVPALMWALRDPVVATAAWACDALAKIGDEAALPAVQRYYAALIALASTNRWPDAAGSRESLIAQAAVTRFKLGDEDAEQDLIASVLAEDMTARQVACAALRSRYGTQFEIDPAAPLEARRAAIIRWQGEESGSR